MLSLRTSPKQQETTANHVTNIDPFAEADEDTGETKQAQNYIHIRIQRTLPSNETHNPRFHHSLDDLGALVYRVM